MSAGKSGPPGGPRGPGRPLDAELGPAILRAVQEVLAESGYARLTTTAVAERAGVSTATLYRRWPNKRLLVLAAARQLAAEHPAPAATGDAAEDLRALLEHKRRLFAAQTGRTALALLGEAGHDPQLAEVLGAALLEPCRRTLEGVVERARERGERLDRSGVEPASRVIIGLALTRAAFPPREAAPGAQEAELDAVLHLLREPEKRHSHSADPKCPSLE